MSENKTLLVGMPSELKNYPLETILTQFGVFRDAIAGTAHYEYEELPEFLANVSFHYAFNSFKAAGLLLTELYHEAAAAVVRQLWEVSLNLHWMMADPVDRAEAFVSFTTVEARKLVQHSDKLGSLDSFDKATQRFQARFRTRGRKGKGKERIQTNFSSESIRDRAIELGDPWEKDYEIVYHLTSMHAHGAPGAVLHAVFQNHYGDVGIRERDATAILAILAVNIMKRNVDLLTDQGIIPDKSLVENAYQAFMAIVKPTDQTTND